MIPFKTQAANWPTDANETWWQNGDNDDDDDGAVGASNDDDDDDYSDDGGDVDLGNVSLRKSMMQIKNPDK